MGLFQFDMNLISLSKLQSSQCDQCLISIALNSCRIYYNKVVIVSPLSYTYFD